MKKFKCYDCDEFFEAMGSEETLKYLYSHYIENHNEILTGWDEGSKKLWMKRFYEDWAETKDN